jgi:hypothetical protein
MPIMAGGYRVVFDVSTEGSFHPVLLLCGVFVIVLYLWICRTCQTKVSTLGISGNCCGRYYVRALARITYLGGRKNLIDALVEGRCKVVEGVVSNFSRMPPGGKGWESFEVSGVSFRYSDNIYSRGFHQTTARGGPVAEGQQVRIAYLETEIARLEIKKGTENRDRRTQRKTKAEKI